MFTEADVKTLLRAATGSSAPTSSHSCSLLPPSLELVSGGLILEKHAISVIEQAIFSERPGMKFYILCPAHRPLCVITDVDYPR